MSIFSPGVPVVFLRPGEMHYAGDPVMVSTVLGSCISVTMYSPRFNLGAICHAVLPTCRNGGQCAGNCPHRFKYVDCSVRNLVHLFETQGITRQELIVKVFGGSNMMTEPDRMSHPGVGAQNIVAARDVLSEERLRVAVSDTGGPTGRKVLFFTGTGEVLLKRLNKR